MPQPADSATIVREEESGSRFKLPSHRGASPISSNSFMSRSRPRPSDEFAYACVRAIIITMRDLVARNPSFPPGDAKP